MPTTKQGACTAQTSSPSVKGALSFFACPALSVNSSPAEPGPFAPINSSLSVITKSPFLLRGNREK
jgi:hypothetical protein